MGRDRGRERPGPRSGAVLDPEFVQAGIALAGRHIEAGSRSFADYAAAMIADLGVPARPWLRSWYEAVRHRPGFDGDGMTPPDAIDDEEARPPLRKARDRAGAAPGRQKPPALEGAWGELDDDVIDKLLDEIYAARRRDIGRLVEFED